MEKRKTTFALGTGGWEHEAFDDVLYPAPHLSSQQKLAYYSRFFDSVEVRSTFWDDSVTARDAGEWIAAVAGNKRFTFNIKLHLQFTHKKIFKPELTRNVRGILQELARNDRLGSLLIQFPYSFTNTSAHRFHLVKLAEVFSGFRSCVEFRHESWNQGNVWELIRDHGLNSVSPDLPRVKQLMSYATTVGGDRVYVRLHGRNENGWLLNGMETRYDYLYNSREIRELARRLNHLAEKCGHVTVICNNTTKGKAVATAFQLLSAVHGKRVDVAPRTLQAFPHLHDVADLNLLDAPPLAAPTYKQAM